MGLVQERTMAWKWLKEQVKLVHEPILQKAMMADFRQRALREWGYCPETGAIAKGVKPELDEWEKELVADINEHNNFEIDTRKEKREQTHKEAKARMLDFIAHGGNLLDIPDDIRTDTVEKLYYECLMEYGDNLLAEADRLIGVQ
jgi:hypothetical protein